VTDPYINVLNALMAAVRTLTDYFPKDYQVTTDKPDITRGADYWFICNPGAFSDVRLEAHDSIVTWQTRCELAVRYTIYSQRMLDFLAVRGAVRAKLKEPRALPNIRLRPPVLVAGEDLRQDIAGPTPNFIVQPLLVTINQIVSN
jgi:hypothetical protein